MEFRVVWLMFEYSYVKVLGRIYWEFCLFYLFYSFVILFIIVNVVVEFKGDFFEMVFIFKVLDRKDFKILEIIFFFLNVFVWGKNCYVVRFIKMVNLIDILY